MRRFAQLFRELDESNRTLDKIEAMRRYFASAPAADAAWVLWFLHGNRLQLGIPSKRLRQWASDLSGHPDWLVDACYERVGDLAETAALLLPLHPTAQPPALHQVIRDHLLPLKNWDDRFQFQLLKDFWTSLPRDEVLLLNKMLTGAFRVGVSRALLVRALAEAIGVDRSTLTHRLMGDWKPTAIFFESLKDPAANASSHAARPYPFYLASPLANDLEDLGSPTDWSAEWKWDGIRAQLIRRNGQTHLWSRGDERLTESFPEIIEAGNHLPDGSVLDGELLCWEQDRPLGFHVLQTRLNRKTVDPALLKSAPVHFIVYDCMEFEGADSRHQALHHRRKLAHSLLAPLQTADPHSPAAALSLSPTALSLSPIIQTADPHSPATVLSLSPIIAFTQWDDLRTAWTQSRQRGVEGIMLKRLQSDYKIGRVRGDWWKWKVDPYTADLVLIYAQAGHGRRASLYTDYTLAARHEGAFVPVAKAYSGLSDTELRQIDRWIKQNTLAKRGPVRTVPPTLVFEIGFEGIRPSNRHRSGIALRFPRILRWRHDKTPEDADSVQQLQGLMEARLM
jgi:DNA ligase-1